MATTQRNPRQTPATSKAQRLQRVLAKVRQRQLELAIEGRIEASARYACLASRVRRQAQQASPLCPCCAA